MVKTKDMVKCEKCTMYGSGESFSDNVCMNCRKIEILEKKIEEILKSYSVSINEISEKVDKKLVVTGQSSTLKEEALVKIEKKVKKSRNISKKLNYMTRKKTT